MTAKCIVCDEECKSFVVLHKTRRRMHCLCPECIVGFVEQFLTKFFENIERGVRMFPKVICPGLVKGLLRNRCKCEIQPLTLLDLPTDVIFPENFLLNVERAKMLLQRDDTFLCPKKECRNICILEGRASIRCFLCATIWCTNCSAIPYHTGKTCLEHELENVDTENGKYIKDLAKEGKIKKCPGCKILVMKHSGCNKMKCESCGMHWCWLCEEKNIDYPHFNPINGKKCANMLFARIDESL
jgi:hypothetical protein